MNRLLLFLLLGVATVGRAETKVTVTMDKKVNISIHPAWVESDTTRYDRSIDLTGDEASALWKALDEKFGTPCKSWPQYPGLIPAGIPTDCPLCADEKVAKP